MPEFGTYDRATAEWVLNELQRLIRIGALEIPREAPHNDPPHTPWYVVNTDSQDVPPYGCMQVIATENPEGDTCYLKVSRPVDTDAEAGWYVFNGSETIGTGATVKYGVCQVGPHVRGRGPTSTAGERFRPVVDSWDVGKNDGGPFIAAGPDQIASGIQRLFIAETPRTAVRIKGELTACLKKCEDATVRIYNPEQVQAWTMGRSECGSYQFGPAGINMSGATTMPAIPELDFAGGQSVTLTALNVNNLHAIKDSGAWIEIIYGADKDSYRIELTQVEDNRAEWVKGRWGGSEWTYTGTYKDGSDPSVCGTPEITSDFDTECIADNTETWAFYDPKADEYIALPPPLKTKKQTLPIGAAYIKSGEECELTLYQNQIEVTVIDCGPEKVTEETFYKFDWSFFDALCFCEYLCYCPTFIDPQLCDDCEGDCVWEYQSDGSFELDSNTCDPYDSTCGCADVPEIGDPDVPFDILPGDTISRKCKPDPPSTDACCNNDKEMDLFVWDYSSGDGRTATATSITKVSDCEFELTLECDNEGTVEGTVVTRMTWLQGDRFGSSCDSSPTPDDGQWRIVFDWPAHPNDRWQAVSSCGCCDADFATGPLLSPGGTILNDLSCT